MRPDDRRLPRSIVAVSIALVATVAAVAVALTHRSSKPAPTVQAVSLRSSTRHQFADLQALVDASDLVVTGRVVADETGRLFGDGASGSAVRSHVLTLELDEVMVGEAAAIPKDAPAVVLVEEEHSLADGTPVAIDGMRRTRAGDRGVWFLTASTDPDFPGYALVNTQSRYLLGDDGTVHGGDQTDRLVRRIEGLGSAVLRQAIRDAAGT